MLAWERLLCNRTRLGVLLPKVRKMIQQAKKAKTKGKSAQVKKSRSFFTFHKKHKKSSSIPVVKKPVERSHKNGIRNDRRYRKRSCPFQVFLGGSCNPTTWRKDIAIPKLEKKGITFFNPQVTNWSSELIESENKAKEHADVMFFVIDSQTRSVASIIEVSYVIGNQKQLVLVMNELEGLESLFMNNEVTKREFQELQEGRYILRKLVKSHGIYMSNDINKALDHTGTVVSTIDNELKKSPLTKYNPFLFKRKRSKLQDIQTYNNICKKSFPTKFHDIYIGSTKGFGQKELTTLMIKKAGLVPYYPENLANGGEIQVDPEAINNNKVILFVISDDIYGLADLTLAAYYLGLCSSKIVLCIQYLQDGVCIEGEKLSPQTVKDYNRGRRYLLDLACQKKVKVFDNVQEAVQCAIEKCQNPSDNLFSEAKSAQSS